MINPQETPDWALGGEVRGSRVDAKAYAAAAGTYDAWPVGWPDSWRQEGKLWRTDIFDVVASWRTESLPTRHVVTAVCAWGHGANGYGPWRTARTLGAEQLDRRLEALDPLRGEHVDQEQLIAAYQAFGDFRRSRLPWFRAPFFTKLLYFAGYRRDQDGVQPLILDSVVTGRLPDNLGVRKPVGSRVPAWTSSEWIKYLTWAKANSGNADPDRVEMRLFSDRS